MAWAASTSFSSCAWRRLGVDSPRQLSPASFTIALLGLSRSSTSFLLLYSAVYATWVDRHLFMVNCSLSFAFALLKFVSLSRKFGIFHRLTDIDHLSLFFRLTSNLPRALCSLSFRLLITILCVGGNWYRGRFFPRFLCDHSLNLILQYSTVSMA